jgi:hypothetical protein
MAYASHAGDGFRNWIGHEAIYRGGNFVARAGWKIIGRGQHFAVFGECAGGMEQHNAAAFIDAHFGHQELHGAGWV